MLCQLSYSRLILVPQRYRLSIMPNEPSWGLLEPPRFFFVLVKLDPPRAAPKMLRPKKDRSSMGDTGTERTWWRGEDSNLRRHRQQIYSLSPLAAREPLRLKTQTSIWAISSWSRKTMENQ